MAEPDSFGPKLPVLTAGKILLLEMSSSFGKLLLLPEQGRNMSGAEKNSLQKH